jgi:hypothetical protein
MALEPKENHKNVDEIQEDRRSFLKKAAYSAPALIALGQLARPARVEAESAIPDPFGVERSSRTVRPSRAT